MFVRNKAFSEWRLLKQCKILYFLSRTSNNDDEEFLVLSDRFEWKNLYFPHEVDSTFNLNEMIKSECLSQFRFGKKRHSDAIAFFHIKCISSVLKINDLSFLNTFKYIYYLRVLSLGLHSCCHSVK